MDAFEQLSRVTEQAREENDLPDFLAIRLCRIAQNRDILGEYAEEIVDLAHQVEQYDTYGQTGYMGMGVNNVVLEAAIRRIEKKSAGSHLNP